MTARPRIVDDESQPAPTLTRSVTFTIEELAPDRGQLPYCSAWMHNGLNCPNRARYWQSGKPLCGMHVGRPGTVFIP